MISDEEDEDGDLFGGMLDEPVITPGIQASSGSTNSTITVRPMPVPKSFANLGSVPKAMLKSTVQKLAKYAVVNYACLSGPSRAARAGVEIRWSSEKRQIWIMDDIACESMVEAENYVSTLALHALVLEGTVQVNWRVLPPVFRELWEELDTDARVKRDSASRAMWKSIQDIVDSKIVQAEPAEMVRPALASGFS